MFIVTGEAKANDYEQLKRSAWECYAAHDLAYVLAAPNDPDKSIHYGRMYWSYVLMVRVNELGAGNVDPCVLRQWYANLGATTEGIARTFWANRSANLLKRMYPFCN